MNIIKLSAIDSTNSYLKKLAQKSDLDTFTVVVAEHQTEGRGQMGTNWVSDYGKNLTFSILIKFKEFEIAYQFYLSMAVSLGLLEVLKKRVDVSLFIKWPNDILAENDKVAGILIENVLKGNFIRQSIIGMGINLNQESFPKDIENVTSLKNISGTHFNADQLLNKIVNSISYYVQFIEKKEFVFLKKCYMKTLYKFQKPSMFVDANDELFLGKIIDVEESGRLIIELENETTRKFSLKEVKFASR